MDKGAFVDAAKVENQGHTNPQRKEIFMNFTKNIGFLLLAIWLILTGLSAFVSMGGLGTILSILALAAGVFILLGR